MEKCLISQAVLRLIKTENQGSTYSTFGGIAMGSRCDGSGGCVCFAGGWWGSGPRLQMSLSGDKCTSRTSSLQSPSLSVRGWVTADVSGLLVNVIPDLFVLLVKSVYLES